MRSSFQRLKRQGSGSTTPEGQKSARRPYDNGREVDAILDMWSHFWNVRLHKMAMDVHWKCESIGIAAKRFRRQHGVEAQESGLERQWEPRIYWNSVWTVQEQNGVGAATKGHGRTLRLHDSWKAPDSILDQETSEHLGRYNGVAKACGKR